MPRTFTYQFDTPSYKGSSTIHTGLFINGQRVDPRMPRLSVVVSPGIVDIVSFIFSKMYAATSKLIVKVAAGSSKDMDLAVNAANKAYKTSWGLKVPGAQRRWLFAEQAGRSD